jgi:TrmH family RNA methyltransferase
VPSSLGAHSPRIAFARDLLSKRGRREHGKFTFEGPTLLAEADAAGVPVEAVYATPEAFEQSTLIQRLDGDGTPVYLVDERSMKRISDVESPPGIVAVAPIRLESASGLLTASGTVLALADVGDPGNAGTLLRTAEAFGIGRVLCGTLGADPYLPKVVRSAMGAVFRLQIATGSPADVRPLLAGWQVTGLDVSGTPLGGLEWGPREVLVIGGERRGLGPWRELCTRLAGIPMAGKAESLNASSAGAIAMYEATGRRNS